MILDTNIVIAALKAEPRTVAFLTQQRREGKSLIIPAIVVAETLSFPKLSENEVEIVSAFLKTFPSIPFDNNVAHITASFRRRYGLEIPDAGIAATAFIMKLPLLTRDRSFLKVKEISIVNI